MMRNAKRETTEIKKCIALGLKKNVKVVIRFTNGNCKIFFDAADFSASIGFVVPGGMLQKCESEMHKGRIPFPGFTPKIILESKYGHKNNYLISVQDAEKIVRFYSGRHAHVKIKGLQAHIQAPCAQLMHRLNCEGRHSLESLVHSILGVRFSGVIMSFDLYRSAMEAIKDRLHIAYPGKDEEKIGYLLGTILSYGYKRIIPKAIYDLALAYRRESKFSDCSIMNFLNDPSHDKLGIYLSIFLQQLDAHIVDASKMNDARELLIKKQCRVEAAKFSPLRYIKEKTEEVLNKLSVI